MNYEGIGKHAERITKIKPYVNKSEKNDWKKFENNNMKIALSVLYAKKEEIYPSYVSEHNSNPEKQLILLMISNRENCFHSFATENKLQLHKRVYENKDFCDIIMPFEDTKILKFNRCQNSDKAPSFIYADLECIIENIDGCKNNPENPSTTKVSKHIPSSCSMSTISLLRSIQNKHYVYRGKDYMKIFCEFLRE